MRCRDEVSGCQPLYGVPPPSFVTRRQHQAQNVYTLTRRELLRANGASALVAAANPSGKAAEDQQADKKPAACSLGICTQWTAMSQPVDADDWVPFEEAVSRFSPPSYVDQVAGVRAQYVIFTGTHALRKRRHPAPPLTESHHDEQVIYNPGDIGDLASSTSIWRS